MSGVLRTALCRLRPVIKPNVTQKATFVYGPPANRIPIQEKYALFSAALVIIFGPSIYVLVNLDSYKNNE